MKRIALATLSLVVLLLAVAPSAAVYDENPQGPPGPQGPEEGATRRQLWLIPIPGERLLMHAYVMRPPGDRPFPLVVINHGSVQYGEARSQYPMPDYPLVSQWFLDRGYAVVLPQRPGHGETGGPYFEDQGSCDDADYKQAGLRTADSIAATVDYMTAQPFVRKTGVVVVGQSAGGWGALALASRNPPAVQAVINFAGGRGGKSNNIANHNCSPDHLIATAGEFGGSARVPTLWLYSESDDYFGPDLSQRLYLAYRSAGGLAEYHLVPPFGAEGHAFINFAAAVDQWAPLVQKFLSGME
jgi:dienelactone hydrolase